MKITPLQNENSSKQTNFKKLLPNNAQIRLALFDVDETLINWDRQIADEVAQSFRDRISQHIQGNNIISAYSSDRGFNGIYSLVEHGIIKASDFIVGNNGGTIHKLAKNGGYEEIALYTSEIRDKFSKGKVRELMANIANKPENMFSSEEWSKVPQSQIPKGQKEFRGSKITEYEGQESPTSMRFALAPGMYDSNIDEIQRVLKENGLDVTCTHFHYPAESLTEQVFRKYISPTFSEERMIDMLHHVQPRRHSDGSGEALMISATDKGKASEYIRTKLLGINKEEVFAAGDGENDFPHANKGYFFGLISNASAGLRKLITNSQATNIIQATKPGAEGIVDILI